jgi:hypothetical protein
MEVIIHYNNQKIIFHKYILTRNNKEVHLIFTLQSSLFRFVFNNHASLQLLIEIGEILKEAIVEFKRWHFEQTWKYTNALDAPHEHI